MNPTIRCQIFARSIRAKQEEIVSLLLEVQSVHTTLDEIHRSLDVLETVDELAHMFRGVCVSKIASFLPLNLPLYSIVVFACIPSLQANEVIVRAPTSMHKMLSKLVRLIELQTHFPNIQVYSGDRQAFVDHHCKQSQVVLFTGKPKNFKSIQKQCGRNTLLLYNGAGHNPVVVTEFADVDLAVRKTIEVKLFNNGQDCAGADAILVHQAVAPIFIEQLIAQLKTILVVDKYHPDKDKLCVGPLYDLGDVQRSVNSITRLVAGGMKILYGGVIDLRLSKVSPTVLVGEVGKHNNYGELYAPIFPVLTYYEDSDLKTYFLDEKREYKENEMYVSVFGHSQFLSTIRSSIILQDKSIHDVERGNYEYGGYGTGASAWSYKGLTVYKPLLIPQEIQATFGSGTFAGHIPHIKGSWPQMMFEKLFPEKVREIFGANAVFAYGFGSFAAERDARTSDIDTLVCVHEVHDQQVSEYLDWIFELHHFLGKVIDFTYPTEIVALETIRDTLERLSNYEMQADTNPSWAYDGLIWAHSLGGPQIGIVNQNQIPEEWRDYMSKHQRRMIRAYLQNVRTHPVHSQKPMHADIPQEDSQFDKWLQSKYGSQVLSIARTIPFDEKPALLGQAVIRLKRFRQIGSRNLSIRDFMGSHGYKV